MIDEEDYETDDLDSYEEYREEFDISKICSLMRTAWKIMPKANFAEFINAAIPANLDELSGSEMEELLEEFIHQNM